MKNFFKDKNKNVAHRKESKEYFDSLTVLATPENQPKNGTRSVKHATEATFTIGSEQSMTVRLLDEGTITFNDGSPYCYIPKGELRKMVDKLQSDDEIQITVGHIDFLDAPFPVGYFTKNDLSITSIADGREAVDVTIHLDSESLYLKELKRLNIPLGLSAEYTSRYTYEGIYGETMPGVFLDTELELIGCAIVASCGNVSNENSIKLKEGRREMQDKEKVIEQLEALVNPKTPEVTTLAEPVVEPVGESVVEPVVKPAEGVTASAEQQADTLATELASLNASLEKFTSDNATLLAANATLEARVQELTTELAEKDKTIEQARQLVATFKKMSVSAPDETKKLAEPAVADAQKITTPEEWKKWFFS